MKYWHYYVGGLHQKWLRYRETLSQSRCKECELEASHYHRELLCGNDLMTV